MFHVGVLAPTLESAAALLRRVRTTGGSVATPQPELTLSWSPLGTGSEPWQRADPETTRTQLVLSSVRLRQAGADFFVCTDDTVYGPLESAGPNLAIPGLHAAPVVAAEAQRQGLSTVGILGTRWTMSRARYAVDFEPMGITAIEAPLWDQTTLHSIIFDELAQGRFTLRSRDTVLAIIDGLRRQGCQAVVLGCPDLASLVTPASSSLRLLDSTTLLADSALAVAVGDAPLPRWRGGPLVAETDLDPHGRYSTR